MSSSPQYIILKEGSSESKGREAQRNNIQAAKLIAEIVRTSLGPRGMDKMLVDSLGDVTITNDGATMLKEIDVQHPAAKMLVEVSKATDNEVGDGTTSAVILAGALLEKAEELIDKGVHPTVIVDGYMKALEKAEQVLEKIAEKVDPTIKGCLHQDRDDQHADQARLRRRAGPRGARRRRGHRRSPRRPATGYKVDIDNVKVEKKPGGSLMDTKLITGSRSTRRSSTRRCRRRSRAPRSRSVNSPLEIEKTEFGAEININDPDQMQKFLDEENNMLKGMVDKVADVRGQRPHLPEGHRRHRPALPRQGGHPGREARQGERHDQARKGHRSAGSSPTSTTSRRRTSGTPSSPRRGRSRRTSGSSSRDARTRRRSPSSISGGTQRVVDEAERSMHDALMVTKDVIEKPAIVAGGGAPEVEVAYQVREWAQKLTGREQLAALRSSPRRSRRSPPSSRRTQAWTRSTRRSSSGRGTARARSGRESTRSPGKVANMCNKDVVEPLAVKLQILKAATEAACMILRIDDVIASSKMSGPPPGAGGRRHGRNGRHAVGM